MVRNPMKKTFNLTHPKIKYPRMVDAAKNEVRKYIKRERRKELPEGVDFWDFDCRFGDAEAEAKVIHPAVPMLFLVYVLVLQSFLRWK